METDLAAPESVETTIPETGKPLADAVPEFSTMIPEGYGEKDWVKDLSNSDDPRATLFKMVEDQRAVISERPAGIPHENATPEQRAEFNKAFGVHENAADYKISVAEGKEVDANYEKGVGELMLKAGISKHQFEILEPGFNELLNSLAPDTEAAAEKADADFDKLALDTFGGTQKEVDEVLKQSNLLLGKYTPEGMEEHIKNLPNEQLIVMAGVLNNIRKEFISPDALPADGGAQVAAQTDADNRSKGKALMGTVAYNDPMHADHNAVVKQIGQLYGTWRE